MNRRRQHPRLRVLDALKALAGRFTRIRLPRLRRSNRRKFAILSRKSVDTASDHATDPTAPATRGRLGTAFAWLAPIAIAIAAFSAPVFGVKAVNYVRTSQHFHVREIIVEGDRRISAAEAVKLAGIEPGTSVLEADLENLAAPLRAHPWVRWAKVEKQLPDRLVIQMIEREAAAYLSTGELWLVDETGEVFAPAEPAEAIELPVISGFSDESLADAMADPSLRAQLQIRLQGALNLARTWQLANLAGRYPLGEIRIDPVRGYVVVAGGTGAGAPTEIVLGEEPFREKLQRLEFTLEALRVQGRAPEYVLLDVGDDAMSVTPRQNLALARHLRGARVIVKTSDESAHDDDAPIVDAGPAFVGPPLAPVEAIAPKPERPQLPARKPRPQEVEPVPEVAPEPIDIIEAAPLTGGRPADISAGMEE